MLLVDGGDVVDVEHLAGFHAFGFETHVVYPLSLYVGAEALLGICCIDHQGFAIAVDEIIHDAGVLSFSGIFSLESPVAVG